MGNIENSRGYNQENYKEKISVIKSFTIVDQYGLDRTFINVSIDDSGLGLLTYNLLCDSKTDNLIPLGNLFEANMPVYLANSLRLDKNNFDRDFRKINEEVYESYFDSEWYISIESMHELFRANEVTNLAVNTISNELQKIKNGT